MTNYQTLKSYDGSLYGKPEFRGLEYDWEVPDNLVVASPGGVSSVHHHWTKGFNGRGNTSADIYAGEGDRYIAGEYGNMYQSGQSAAQAQGYYSAAPDYQYWQNETPPQYSLGGEQINPFLSKSGLIYPPTNSTPSGPKSIEKYELSTNDFELIEPSYNQKKSPQSEHLLSDENIKLTEKKAENVIKVSKISPLILFVFFVLLFMTFHFWANASDSFLSQVVHKGKTVKWQQTLLYAIIMSIIFIVIVWILGIPLITFE